MLPFKDAYSLAALFHLNSEPWNNIEAYNESYSRLNEFRPAEAGADVIELPPVSQSPLVDLLAARNSCRDFEPSEIQLEDLAAVLDAGYGVSGLRTFPDGLKIFKRTVPSAGALYPLELFVLAARTAGVSRGLYHFNPRDRILEPLLRAPTIADLLPDLMQQHYLENAAALIFLAAVFPRTLRKYGPRGYRYVLLEAGHAAQNICLRAVEIGLATLCTGGYSDSRINSLLQLKPRTEGVVYAIALGRVISKKSEDYDATEQPGGM